MSQPLKGSAHTDPYLSSQQGEAFAVFNVSPQQPFVAKVSANHSGGYAWGGAVGLKCHPDYDEQTFYS